MEKRHLLVIFTFMMLSLNSFSNQGKNFIEAFDLSTYFPQKSGLRDLAVDVRLQDLTKQLNEQLIYGKLNDVYFQAFYKVPEKRLIRVEGLGNGFNEIKAELTKHVYSRFDFIVPQKLSERLKNYELKIDIEKSGDKTVTAIDPKNMSAINKIIFSFTNENVLQSMITYSPNGVETINLDYKKYPWSQGKYALSTYSVEKDHGKQKLMMEVKISYKEIKSIGLPKKLSIKTSQILPQPGKGPNDTYQREFTSELSFSNYRVNGGLDSAIFSQK